MSFYICIGRSHIPKSPASTQKVPQGFGEAVCHSGKQQGHRVWQHPAALPKLPIPALVATPPFLGHKVIVAPTGGKVQKPR